MNGTNRLIIFLETSLLDDWIFLQFVLFCLECQLSQFFRFLFFFVLVFLTLGIGYADKWLIWRILPLKSCLAHKLYLFRCYHLKTGTRGISNFERFSFFFKEIDLDYNANSYTQRYDEATSEKKKIYWFIS